MTYNSGKLQLPEGSLNMKRRPQYTVSDGKLLLTLILAEEGGYLVRSPLDPELISEAETLEEAFENAYDAMLTLKQSRQKNMPKRTKARAGR